MVIEELLKQVAERENCDVEEIEWYSWPQTFGTTAGPSGAGGNMMTACQVYAFHVPSGNSQRYCAGHWRRWNGEFMQCW